LEQQVADLTQAHIMSSESEKRLAEEKQALMKQQAVLLAKLAENETRPTRHSGSGADVETTAAPGQNAPPPPPEAPTPPESPTAIKSRFAQMFGAQGRRCKAGRQHFLVLLSHLRRREHQGDTEGRKSTKAKHK
jgi:hypothetical protein